MNLEEYQKGAAKYRLASYIPEAAVFGLCAEAGEVAAVFQKMIRGDYPVPEAMARLHKELGDILWHIAAIADDNDWTLEDIAKENLDKLESRKLRNMIMGNGDNR